MRNLAATLLLLGLAEAQETSCPAKSDALLQTAVRNASHPVALSSSEGCGMGTPGACYTNTDWHYKLLAFAPGASHKFFETFFKVWESVTPLTGYVFCWGDREGSWVVSNTYGQNSQLYDSYQGLTYLRNLFISPDDSSTWATLGLYLPLYCPPGQGTDLYTELKAAFAFNGCGTGVNFMFSISADTIECFAQNFAPPIAEIAGLIPELSFGISLDRKLSKTLTLAHGDGDDIRVGSITMTAHLALSTTLRFSIGEILDMKEKLGDVLAGDLQCQVALAYDGSENLLNALTWVTSSDISDSLPDLLGGFASAYYLGPALAAIALQEAGASGNVVSLVEGMQRATIMFSVTGYVTLQLAGGSGGIFPDVSFQLFKVGMMVRTGPAGSSEDSDDAESHLPGLYFYLSADIGSFVESIVGTIFGQIGGLLDVVGVNVDSGVSLNADGGIGFFINSAGLGFYSKVKVGGSTTEVRCVFKFGNQKLRCKARLGWAELFLQGGKYVLNKINNFAGNGAQEVAEFYKDNVGSTGAKFGKSVVNKGKKVANKVKCKVSNLLGGSCGKSGGTPSSCGDGTEYVIKNEQDFCLKPSPDCYEPDSNGEVNFYKRSCRPAFDECTHFDGSYAEQMKNFWWYTKDRHLCNEFMHNMYFNDISDPDNNPKCLRLSDAQAWFSLSPTQMHISKKSTERFRVAFDGVTGPYGQVCFSSSGSSGDLNQGRRRRRQVQVPFVRGYDGGRRRRRCDKDGAKKMRIYQKLEPGNGGNYEKENGDAQFLKNCNR